MPSSRFRSYCQAHVMSSEALPMALRRTSDPPRSASDGASKRIGGSLLHHDEGSVGIGCASRRLGIREKQIRCVVKFFST